MSRRSVAPASRPLTAAIRRTLFVSLVAALPLGTMAQETAPAEGDDAVTLDQLEVRSEIPRNSGTVTKTDTPITEIPQSISVITAEQMRDWGIHGIEEAVWFTAGAQGGGYGVDSRSDWLLVRGFTPARYLDGLALADGSGTGITRIEPWGLERVEVLKGPSSVSYGAMPPGGMMNYVSKRPTGEEFGELELQAGTDNLFSVAGDFGGNFGGNPDYSWRLTGLARNSDTMVDYIHDDRYYFAPALSMKFDDANRLTVLARWQRNDTKSGGGFLPAAGTLLDNPHGKIPDNRYTGEPGWNDYDKTMASLGYEFEHDFGGGARFRQNVRYGTTEIEPSTQVGAFGLLADERTLFRYLWRTQEDSKNLGIDNQLQVDFDAGAVEHVLLAGLDFRRGENDYASAFDFSAPTLDIFNPVYGAPIVEPAFTSRTVQEQAQTGLYLQDQISVGGWVVTAGGRMDWVGTDTDELFSGSRAHQSDEKFSGRVGVNYVFDNGFAPYAGWSQSFQPTVGTDFFGDAFEPTTGEQVEIGLKYQPNDRRILATFALYELVQENTLTVDPNHTLYSIQQGETKVRGAELEGRWNNGNGLTVYGAYAWIDSEVTRTTDPLSLGKEIALQPRNTASIGADYTISEGALAWLGFGLGVRYTGEHYGDAYNLWETPSYTLVDASVHYDIGQWRLQLNASNLTDKEYVSACNSAAWCYYGYPRTVTATARLSW